MFLEHFHSSNNNNVTISAGQGSSFAKTISNDFNPIHDPDSKRFCVPGDLLFALVLGRYGISEKMSFNFSGMVSADTELCFPESPGDHFEIVDGREKSYLEVSRSGQVSKNASAIESLTKNYVYFSGQNFPHLLVPIMAENNIMINPQRPLVIYDSMSLQFDTLDLEEPTVELAGHRFKVEGKRGEVQFDLCLLDQGKQVGSGMKTLILSGLREYEQSAVDTMVRDYQASKDRYLEPA
ncbi:MAG: DUF3581 domain-containing protein [Porticoccaceae bacterium]